MLERARVSWVVACLVLAGCTEPVGSSDAALRGACPRGEVIDPGTGACVTAAPIVPVLECVHETSDGRRIASFGYRNDNAFPVTIATGPDNMVHPRASARMTTFLPGRHAHVLELELGRPGRARWTVRFGSMLNSATATRESRVCGPCEGSVEIAGGRARVGDACGACLDGVIACDPSTGVSCAGAAAANACGGCGVLDAAPGDACDGGALRCAGPDRLVCGEAGRNACGGESPLSAPLGASCGPTHVVVCGDEGDVICATVIDSAGGQVSLGELTIEIPPGALSRPTAIGVEARTAAPEGSAYTAEGVVYALLPHGLRFDSPVEVTLARPEGALEDISLIHDFGDGRADVLVEAIGADERLTVSLDHFSYVYFGWAASCDADRDGYGRSGTYCAVEDDGCFWFPVCYPFVGCWSSRICFVPRCVSTLPCSSPATLDCNDADAAVHPGAAEQCNARDEDCDARIDEAAGPLWYPDADLDGYGAGAGVQACVAPEGHAPSGDDCDDTTSTTYPGATESCNGVDDDCDTVVDLPSCDSDGNPCTMDVCDESGCTSTPVADGTACVRETDDDGTGQCLQGSCLRTREVSFTTDWDVDVWDYYGDVRAQFWSYRGYEAFDPTLGSLRGVRHRVMGTVSFDRAAGGPADEWSLNARFIDRGHFGLTVSRPIDADSIMFDESVVTTAPGDWSTPPYWGYYVHSSGGTTPHVLASRETLTYFYEPDSDGNSCTIDVCDAAGCVSTPRADTSACTIAAGDDGSGQCLSGNCYLTRTQTLTTHHDVAVADHYGTLAAWWWTYDTSAALFDTSLGSLGAVRCALHATATFDRASGSPTDAWSMRANFPDRGYLGVAATIPIDADVLVIDRVAVTTAPGDWSSPWYWGYYVETRSGTTPHVFDATATLTYFFLP